MPRITLATMGFTLGGLLLLAWTCVGQEPASGERSAKPRSSAAKVHGWEPLGLSGGGGMFAPAISRADPKLMMVNCDMSGAYISTDGGHFWKMIHHRQLRGNTRCRPGMHPKDPKVIYAPDRWGGRRIKITRDRGETWQKIGEVDAALRGEIALDPDFPQIMLAGTTDGVRISRDGGKTWARCRGPKGEGISFHFDRTSPKDKRVLFAATKSGLWRSGDGGATWAEKTAGLPEKKIVYFSGGSDPKRKTVMLYCAVPGRAVEGKYRGGIYRSKDRGEHWESAMGQGINKDIKPTGRWADSPVAQYRFVLTTDLKPRTVYALNINTGFHPPHHTTVFRSDDGGGHWRATLYMDPRFEKYNFEPNYVTATMGQSYQAPAFGAALCPSDPERLLYLRESCRLTNNGGQSWFNGHTALAPGQKAGPGAGWICNGLVVTSTWHYYMDPFRHARHYIAYTDIGFATSNNRGKTWAWWKRKGRAPWQNTCYELAFDPQVQGKIWGAFSNIHDIPNGNSIAWWRSKTRQPEDGIGGVCLSTDSGATWKPVMKGLPEAPATSIVLDPKSPKGSRTLYAGVFGKGVYKSTDDGKSWTKKSKGLGAPFNRRVCRVILHKDGTLFALITGRKKEGKFRKEGVGLYRSRDAGENWELISKNPVLLWPKDFAVHPKDSRVIFLGAADARGGDKEQGGLYRTRDGGATWKRVARKGRQHFGAYFHPKKPNWVYLTMCEGAVECPLYLSTDGGDTWKPFDSFPFSNTQRVTVDPDDENVIYVTTFGGSVFRGPAAPKPR